jgi:hypothetical protein
VVFSCLAIASCYPDCSNKLIMIASLYDLLSSLIIRYEPLGLNCGDVVMIYDPIA